MIERWIERLRVARWWSAALAATSHSDYKRALPFISLMEKRPSRDEGNRHKFHVKLLKGYVLGGLGQREEALKTLLEFQRDIVALGFIDSELKYLKAYAASVSADVVGRSGDRDLTADDKSLLNPNYQDIDLSKVPNSTKRAFPLRYHPRWKEIR